MDAIEIWGGVECTENRVGDTFFAQLDRSGHERRLDDLDRFAALGIRALRVPVLWERTAPEGPLRATFTWADACLGRLRALGVRPIVTLVHHGSGPRSTSLVDPGFAEGLARFAGAIAARYPWVDAFTPVNEPLTTARFSGLYGHWYPHGRDGRTFLRALLVQCDAVRRAMRAVRAVSPAAQLVQTEDLGKIWCAGPALRAQAEHENQRRWLSLDLLTGRVDEGHPLHAQLLAWGASPAELAGWVEEPCPPDLVGLNYYLTSERLLDERLDRYPAWSHGGNGEIAYADVEAVRARGGPHGGHFSRLLEVWDRYRRPVAITEVHLGSAREEQLRWLAEAHRAALAARAAGADVRALTAWALLGSFDWDCLVTRDRGHYEPGVFDVRGPAPRPTALAGLVRALCRGEHGDHPALQVPGWWRRPERLLYPAVDAEAPGANAELTMPDPPTVEEPAPILITGARGTLARAFARLCAARGLACRLLGRDALDIADPGSVERAFAEHTPWAVINAAGYVRVDDAERDPRRCERENVLGPVVLARRCRERGARLVTFSSDLVFDGGQRCPYVETDRARPLSVYGHAKAAAEERVLAELPAALVVRTAAFFGPWDEANFVAHAVAALGAGQPFAAAADVVVSPTYVPDLVHAVLDLLVDGERGLWHATNRDALTWADLAERGAAAAQIPATRLVRCPGSALGLLAPRPGYSALRSERGLTLPALDDALARFVAERRASPSSLET